MSSNLPPGVTDADIERFAASNSLLERFERYVNKQGVKMGRPAANPKSAQDNQLFDHIYNASAIPDLESFVERAMTWAHATGYQEGREDALLREPKS